MKSTISIILLIISIGGKAQESDKKIIKNTIDSFFIAFHDKDTVALKQYAKPTMMLQSIGKDKEQQQRLTVSKYSDFVQSIANIPDDVSFEEKILEYNIQIDGDMAHVWTPYEFWLNNVLHHCGVNSFQLFKKEDNWSIIYLVDTRRTTGCSSP